jgi:hypothetical protein
MTSQHDSYLLDFQHFTATTTLIEIPEKAIWFRGSSKYLSGLPDAPLFLSMKHVADFYLSGNPERFMEYYENPEPLRVLDIRFLQMVIPYILSNRTEPLTYGKLEWFQILCSTFGGCSANRQLQLLKKLTNNRPFLPIVRLEQFLLYLPDNHRNTHVSPIEPMGFRIGITDLDYIVLETLKTIFHQIDGFIAPALYSPAHSLLPELILFNPKKSLVPVKHLPDLSTLPVVSLESILQPRTVPIFEPTQYAHQVLIHKGGGYTDDDMALWEERDAYLIRLQTSKRLQKKHKKYQELGNTMTSLFTNIVSIKDANCIKWHRI